MSEAARYSRHWGATMPAVRTGVQGRYVYVAGGEDAGCTSLLAQGQNVLAAIETSFAVFEQRSRWTGCVVVGVLAQVVARCAQKANGSGSFTILP